MTTPLPPPLPKAGADGPPPPAPPPLDEGTFQAMRRIEAGGRTQNNPRDRKRIMPMKLLIIGQPRTGTFSLKAALRRLGYSVYHMESVITNPPDAYMWAEAYKWKYAGKGRPYTREDWDQLLGEVDATIDFPPAGMMPELIAAYPDAQVIVVERDADKWYRSVQATVLRALPALWELPLFFLDAEYFVPFGAMIPWIGQAYGGDLADEARAKRAYRAAYAEVRGLVPEGPRRLEFQPSDGWGPLCKFLGKEEPRGVPFPHLNDTADFVPAIKYTRRMGWRRVGWTFLRWATRLSLMGLIAFGPLLFLPKELFGWGKK